ncbi:MAG: hypothetical protein GY853_01830 [PVC group bacterium]|nr:hypothetical protein [PVC group bacterium]
MIPYVDIELYDPISVYSDYYLTGEDLDILSSMIEEGRPQDAVDYFISQNILPPGIKYQEALSKYLDYSSMGILKEKEKKRVLRNTALLTLGLSSLLYTNYNTFIKKVYADHVFKKAALTAGGAKRVVKDEILGGMEQIVDGTFTQTQFFITNSIKTLQKEMLTANIRLNKIGLKGEAVSYLIEEFKADLKNRYPHIFKAIKDGNVLVTSKYGQDGYRVKHFKVDNYLDSIISKSILDLDRTANVVSATIAGEKVLEFYLANTRKVKKDREICQEIIAKKINGVSVLALDEDTAGKLGIMTVAEAEGTPDFAFSYNCRHGLKRLDRGYLQGINKILGD